MFRFRRGDDEAIDKEAAAGAVCGGASPGGKTESDDDPQIIDAGFGGLCL